ncbi:uncharacterized protein LOC142180986 [Nicotiana tabacum]|uniref:Uncharacterized protein LOC142180986 n=1 Tax=Nicotiana tabacum TaxID=4097 RepID=A0AC58UI89_TOBAC
MAKHNQAWHSEDTTCGIAYGYPSLTNMIKENQERDQVIAGLVINVNVLTKMFIESQTKKVLQNQERSDTSIRNMTELVGSHTASIQKLEMQIRDLSREQNLKQKGTRPSDTIVNPKGSGNGPTSHCMAITTRSGKVHQGENEQVVEVEESEQEVDAQVEESIVVEAKRVPKELKVQEVNREEVKEKVDDSKLEKFYDILKQLSVNIPFLEAFQKMPGFAKYLKDLITKKITTKNEVVNVTHWVSSIITTTTVQKKEDPGVFIIPCTIRVRDFAGALCDNGASINLMPLAIYNQAGLGMPRPISMRLQMADRYIKRTVGNVDDVLVQVGEFHLPTDFVILDCAVDKEILIISGRPFLATRRALMDSEQNEIKFRVNDEEVTFQARNGMKLPHEYEIISVIDVVDEVEDAVEIKMEEQCLGDALVAILVNFDGEDIDGYMESVNALEGLGSYTYALKNLSLDLENRATSPAKPSIIEPPQLEFKPLPPHSRRFIKDFSKIANPMCKLFEKDAKFVFDEKCLKDFEELKQKLTMEPIIATPDWSIPFELMCDANGVAIGAVLGQHHNKVLHLVYYASKTLNGAQMNYRVTEQELLAIFYDFEKFWAYLLGSKVIVYTDHTALRYLMAKKDAKARLIRWVLLLQEFDFKVKDRKGTENQVVDHLSRLEEAGRQKKDLEINDAFPDEHILALSNTFAPWYADISNFLECRHYYWEEPFLFRNCADNIIRRCVPEDEVMQILKACHDSLVGGPYGGNHTAAKVLECGYYWPTIYEDANQMVKACDQRQRQGSISKRHEMPMNFILKVEIFDV